MYQSSVFGARLILQDSEQSLRFTGKSGKSQGISCSMESGHPVPGTSIYSGAVELPPSSTKLVSKNSDCESVNFVAS